MLLAWYSFYLEESFECTHFVCTWNISVPLQQVRLQGKQLRIFRQTYSLDTRRQGAPMFVVSWHAYFKSSHGKAHWIFTLNGQLREEVKKNPLNLWSWSYLAGPPPLFFKTAIALGHIFLPCFFMNWIIEYVLKLILVMFKTNFGYFLGEIYPKNVIDRHNQFQEIG